jgi:2-methylcitrate dehydratase
LGALAVAYLVHCRLSDEAPVRARGFDHTTQGVYAVAAGTAKALRLDPDRTANAIAIAGTSQIALRVTRTGALSHWKGLAYPWAASGALQATFLAEKGITGPIEVFEGNKGFMDAIAGPFEIDWTMEDLERVRRTVLKKYNAEVHAQSTLEGILELKEAYEFSADEIDAVRVGVFDVAFHIIGGGEEGIKTQVGTKEEADHSLPYMVAVALLDGKVLPEQYAPERIARSDVQTLLRKVEVYPDPVLSSRFPDEHSSKIEIRLGDGRTLSREKRDYEGFHSRPLPWAKIVAKFSGLTKASLDAEEQEQIVNLVHRLEQLDHISTLTALLAAAKAPGSFAVMPAGERPYD